MKTHRTLRYRLHPDTQAKAHKLHELARACRYVWNHFVGVLRDEYEACGKCDPRWYSLNIRFTNLRKQLPWQQGYSCAIVRQSLKPIETTYKKFYANKGGLPRFHGKHTHAPSVPLGSGMFKQQGDFLHIQKIVQARTDWCQQVSKEIASQYSLVYLEDLNAKAMTKSAKGTVDHPGKNIEQKTSLNREIRASGWSRLEQCLGYKSSVMKVPPAYTSRTCHACGHTDKHNRKTRAYHECVACGYRDHADINAALNILAFGNGACGRGGGGATRPVKRQTDTDRPLRT